MEFFRTDGVYLRANKEKMPWLVRFLTSEEWKISYQYYLFGKNKDSDELIVYSGSYTGEFTSILKSFSKNKPPGIHKILNYQIIGDKKIKYINKKNQEVSLKVWSERQLLYAELPESEGEPEFEFVFYAFPLNYVLYKESYD